MTLPAPSVNSDRSLCSSKTCRVCSLPPDDSPIAYAAGIFDGEGSLVLASQTTNGRTRYWPMMAVQMAKPHALNVLWATLGGRLGPVVRQTRKPGYAAMLRWELSGATARCPLAAMLPFLHVKKDQATLILEMLGREWPASTNGRGICWTPEVSAEWQTAKDRIQALNQRGMAITDGAIAQRVGDQWMTPRVDLFGEQWETFSDRFPTSGSMRSGSIFERRTSVPRTSGGASSFGPGRLLSTPVASDGGTDRGSSAGWGLRDEARKLLPTPRTSDTNGIGHHGTGGPDLRTAVSLLPTPAARDWKSGESNLMDRNSRPLNEVVVNLLPTPTASNPNDGESLESWEARRQRNLAKGINGNGQGTPLAIAVKLLPTPTTGAQEKSTRALTSSSENGRRDGGGQSSSLGLTEVAMLVTGERPKNLPPIEELPPASRDIVEKLLPTPMAGDANGTRNATAGRTTDNPNVNPGWTLSDVVFSGQLSSTCDPEPPTSTGDPTSPPSAAGKPSSDDEPPGPPMLWDA